MPQDRNHSDRPLEVGLPTAATSLPTEETNVAQDQPTRGVLETPDSFNGIRIAVVGGGFSGTATAINILRRLHKQGNRNESVSHPSVSITLIEKGHRLATGLAYGSGRGTDLLNVPSDKMSALDDDPSHFVRWLIAHNQIKPEPDIHFAPRPVYSQYLKSTLDSAIKESSSQTHFRWIEDEAISIHPDRASGRYQIDLRQNSSLIADVVVFAAGWQGIKRIGTFTDEVRASPRFINSAWSPDAFAAIQPTDRVLVIGSGLSMYDTVLTLNANGFRGEVVSLSRRGILPMEHAYNGKHTISDDLLSKLCQKENHRLADTLRTARREIKAIEAAGQNWRALIGALRPVSQAIWKSWSPQDRDRFLRHYGTIWDVHRHRSPPESAAIISAWRRDGRLKIVSGRIEQIIPQSNQFQVHWRPRGESSAIREQPFDWIVNCLGPESDVRKSNVLLMQQLLNDRLVAPHETGIGLRVDDHLQLVNADGVSLESMFLVGPLLRGAFGEATAVPELRSFAARVADTIVGSVVRG